MSESENIRNLKKVGQALGDMCEDMIFVGGAVVELYATDPAPPPVRPTLDVDCVIKMTSRTGFRRIEKDLEKRGFKHDTSEGAPICRWIIDGLQVDIMPVRAEILGFANQWHEKGINHTIRHAVEKGTEIDILSPPFFIASKLEALRDRGGDDLRGAPDFDDVVFVLDNRPELSSEVSRSPAEVREYLRGQFSVLLDSEIIREEIVSVLPPQVGSERINGVLAQMAKIAGRPGCY